MPFLPYAIDIIEMGGREMKKYRIAIGELSAFVLWTVAVCFIDGEFTRKRFKDMGDHALLMPANKEFQPIMVNRENDFQIWGIVRYIIKKV